MKIEKTSTHGSRHRVDAFLSAGSLKLLSSVNADLLLVLSLVLELDGAVDQSKESVILTDTNIVTGPNGGTSLSDYDITGNNALTVSLLNTKSL